VKLRVAIVDDEDLARERLRHLLRKEAEVEIVAECADGASAVAAIREHQPDVVLLDIQMPGMDGFDVIRALAGGPMPAIVFVTAYDHHAVRAFEARALDYLLKPTTRARLHDALTRVGARVKAEPPAMMPQALLDFLAEREQAGSRVRRLTVREGERTIVVPVEEIAWIEAAGNYVLLHAGPQTHIVRETMSALENQLPPELFLRVSRSAMVNLRRIKELRAAGGGEHVAILSDGQKVPVTRSPREVEERLRFA
jgi:two-component system LytT family response regulator